MKNTWKLFFAATAAVGVLVAPARASLITWSYWQLGENTSNRGEDTSSANDGESNPFNNTSGTTWNTATPSGVNGSTTYASTSGANYQGIWMFGAGSDTQTVPSQNWGMQFMVRSTDTATVVPTNTSWADVFGMKDSSTEGLVIEMRRHTDGNVYWDVNRKGQANLIIPRDATTLVVDNTWTALALVQNGGNLEFYVNKQLAGSVAATQGTDYKTDGLFAFGFNQGVGTSNQFKGDFDEASFFTFDAGTFSPTQLIPEPATFSLFGIVGAMVFARRRLSARK